MILEKLVRKNGTAFRIYADIYHAMASIKKSIRKKERSENKYCNAEQIETLRQMISAAEKENRMIYGKNILDGFKDGRKTALLVSHELSFTGAPIALISFAEVLHKKGWQTVMISPDDRGLGHVAEERGIPSIVYEDLYRSDIVFEIVEPFDLVVANTAASAPVICKLDGTDCPVIWWIHEAKAFYGCSTAKMMPRSVKNNNNIYCEGKYTQRVLESRFPKYKAKQLIYCAKDLYLVDSKDVSDFEDFGINKTVFACVGTIEHRKGQDILLEAIELIDDEIREKCLFVFVGAVINNDIKSAIVEAKKKQPDQIAFFEGLPPDDLYEIYKKTDYAICTSRDDPMSLVISETMTLGKPCICSCNSGISEYVRKYETGLVYENNDPHILAYSIAKAYEMTDEEYKKLGVNSRYAFEEMFSEKVFEKNVTEIIDKII